MEVNNNPVISFENVSVRYQMPNEKVSGIKEYTIRWLQRRLKYRHFWALHDVSFQVNPGEVFGIIGRNGAGKSTMLKVMARVLQPTKGRVVIRGKASPLLELGGAFHNELTGRENVFLNMALLGYSRKQTDELFDSIVEFAEIENFIDSPIRTYSTGMVARLGFAVATCTRPEILLVDEVLSVGDTRFQEKCMQRMYAFQNKGTTIVFVSHSMATIEDFCERAAWVEGGQVKAIGPAPEVTELYMNMGVPLHKVSIPSEENSSTPHIIKRSDHVSLTEIGTIYPSSNIFDVHNGSVTLWLKFKEGSEGGIAAIFHSDDSRYILFADISDDPNQPRDFRRVVARAGGNRRTFDKRSGSINFPEVAVYFDSKSIYQGKSFNKNELHLVAMTWKGYPEGHLQLYVDGIFIGEKSYDRRNDDGRPLPGNIAVGMRPFAWEGERVHTEEGSIIDSRPPSSMSAIESGLEIHDLRLYRKALSQEEVLALRENDNANTLEGVIEV